MKTKVTFKKLTLSKQTIADLENAQMKKAQGGIGQTVQWSNCLDCTHSCDGTCNGNTFCTCRTGNPFCNCGA